MRRVNGPRRLKNKGAKRTVALHPEILLMGFVAYVRRTAPRPDDPLFPDIRPQGKDGKRGPRITRWFVEYRKAIEVYRERRRHARIPAFREYQAPRCGH